MVTKLGVANAQQHLLGLFPDGIALQSAFIAPTQVQLPNMPINIEVRFFTLQMCHTLMELLIERFGYIESSVMHGLPELYRPGCRCSNWRRRLMRPWILTVGWTACRWCPLCSRLRMQWSSSAECRPSSSSVTPLHYP